jgi:hypothetical protein
MWVEIEDGGFRINRSPGPPTLEYMQEFVGGSIEPIDLGASTKRRTITAWFNEEGLLLALKPNIVIEGMLPHNAPVRGPVLICASLSNGESDGLSEPEIEQLQLFQHEGRAYPVLQYGSTTNRREQLEREQANLQAFMELAGGRVALIHAGPPEEILVDRCRVCGVEVGYGLPELHVGYCLEHNPN